MWPRKQSLRSHFSIDFFFLSVFLLAQGDLVWEDYLQILLLWFLFFALCQTVHKYLLQKMKHKCKGMNIEYGGQRVCIIQYPSKEDVQCLNQKGRMNIRIFVRGRVDITRRRAAKRDSLKSATCLALFSVWFLFLLLTNITFICIFTFKAGRLVLLFECSTHSRNRRGWFWPTLQGRGMSGRKSYFLFRIFISCFVPWESKGGCLEWRRLVINWFAMSQRRLTLHESTENDSQPLEF